MSCLTLILAFHQTKPKKGLQANSFQGRPSFKMKAFYYCVAALLLLISGYLLATSLYVTTPKLEKRPQPLEDLQPRSLRELHNELVKGSMEMDSLETIKKEPETSWSLPTIAHFIWLGSMIKEKYVENINKFCNHNPEYQVHVRF